MTDKLSEYGWSFQVKVLAAMFVDRTFLQQIADIIQSDYFESDRAWQTCRAVRANQYPTAVLAGLVLIEPACVGPPVRQRDVVLMTGR